jgi:hypothetical protein
MLHGTSHVYILSSLFVDYSTRVKIILNRSILIFLIYLYTCRIGVSLFSENAVSTYRRIGIAVSVSRNVARHRQWQRRCGRSYWRRRGREARRGNQRWETHSSLWIMDGGEAWRLGVPAGCCCHGLGRPSMCVSLRPRGKRALQHAGSSECER